MDMHFFGVPMTSVNKAFFIICIILIALVFILKLLCYLLIQCHRHEQHPNNRLPQHIIYHSAHLPIISTNHLKFPLSSTILLFQSLKPQDIEEDLVHHIMRGQFQFRNSPWWNLCMGRWKECGKVDMQEKRTWSDVDICGNRGNVVTQVLTHMDTLTKYRLACVYKGPCPEQNP